jgi:nucleoside-diphosphate-sugar epimerase
VGAVVIIGASGFIGQHLLDKFKKNAIPIYKGDLDLLDSESVKNFLKEDYTVINCVTYGGKKLVSSTDLKIVQDNLSIFNNFYKYRSRFKRYINIGSGAELNTNLSSYGVSKKVISDFCETTDKFYSLRLFGCFGVGEPPFRLFSSYMQEADDFEFEMQEKLFDNISVQDFCMIVDFFVNDSSPPFKNMDCVYLDKLSVFDQIRSLQKITGKKRPITLSRGIDYIGCGKSLESLKLPLAGFEAGLKQYG